MAKRLGWLLLTTATLLTLPLTGRTAQTPTGHLEAVTIGGGPNKEYNQVAIESNVRYVDSLLPAGTPRTILFADGSTKNAIVQFQPENVDKMEDAEKALRLLFGMSDNEKQKPLQYRAPQLPSLNGPSTEASVKATLAKQTGNAENPLLLYFTGHGSHNRYNEENNHYDLWGNGELNVKDLAGALQKLPPTRPVTLVMVQCFSGAFGNVLFEDGNPENNVTERPVCGFFATTKERVAAGCTAEVNEAEYHDFTSYFFAALAGKDRLGRTVAPPDYDKDGVVGMHEAFAYALITEPSIDVPVATTDVFLRHYLPMKDDEFAAMPFSQIYGMASPAQKVALEGLSKQLGLKDEDRLKRSLAVIRQQLEDEYTGGHSGHNGISEQAGNYLMDWRNNLIRRFPGLKASPNSSTFGMAKEQAVRWLKSRPTDVSRMLKATSDMKNVFDKQYQDELAGARHLRLLRVAKSVVLENQLRGSGDTALIARFDRLQKLEHGNPLTASGT